MPSQAQQDRRIDYIEFPADDLDKTKAFYSRVFRWQFTDYGPDYRSFVDGRLAGGFFKRADGQTGGRTGGGALVVIYAKDLADVERAVVAAGGEITERHEFPGGKRFHFKDPTGNVLAVWSDA